MARSISRVELHEDDSRSTVLRITSEEYQNLHAEMWRRGFRRFIKDSSGNMWRLPPAEYSYVGDNSADALVAKIDAAATKAVGSSKRYSYVLTRTDENRKWGYLKKITVDPDA